MIQQFKCLTCGKTFKVGDWTCTDGISNHIVEEKVYRSLDATHDPSNPNAQRDGRTRVCNIPPPRKVMRGDEVTWVGEGYVEFIRGRFSTSDPEQQYWLDKRPAYNASEEQWKAAWLTRDQQLTIREMELSAKETRLENERNELLSQTKERVAARA
jgi:hypothetical protein